MMVATLSTLQVGGKERRTSCTPPTACFALSSAVMEVADPLSCPKLTHGLNGAGGVQQHGHEMDVLQQRGGIGRVVGGDGAARGEAARHGLGEGGEDQRGQLRRQPPQLGQHLGAGGEGVVDHEEHFLVVPAPVVQHGAAERLCITG